MPRMSVWSIDQSERGDAPVGEQDEARCYHNRTHRMQSTVCVGCSTGVDDTAAGLTTAGAFGFPFASVSAPLAGPGARPAPPATKARNQTQRSFPIATDHVER